MLKWQIRSLFKSLKTTSLCVYFCVLTACSGSQTNVTLTKTPNSTTLPSTTSPTDSSLSINEGLSSFSEVSGKYRLGFTGVCGVDGTSTAAGSLSLSASGATNLTATCTSGVLSGSADFAPPTQAQNKTVTLTYGSTQVSQTLLLCPKNYLAVPAHTGLSVSAFCVAKFEMKAVTTNPITDTNATIYGLKGSQWFIDRATNTPALPATESHSIYWPASIPEGEPMRSVTQRAAVELCDKLNTVSGGTGSYKLMNEYQRSSLSDNIINQTNNWTSGTVSTGKLYVGVDPCRVPANATTNNMTAAADISACSGTYMAAGSAQIPFDDSNGWIGLTSSSASLSGSGLEDRRYLVLSTGQKIWDYSSNVSEQIRITNVTYPLNSLIPSNTISTFNARRLGGISSLTRDINGVFDLYNTDRLSPNNSSPILASLIQPFVSFSTSLNIGLGSVTYLDAATSAGYDDEFVVGSNIYHASGSASAFDRGLYSVSLSNTIFNGNVGFRCVSEPQ